MTKRYNVFDWIRVGALALILVCHFLRQYNCNALDLPFGGVGNMVFFGISGWLLGLAWVAKGRPKYGMEFLFRRIKRLAVPLWIALLIIVCAMLFIGHPVTFKNLGG